MSFKLAFEINQLPRMTNPSGRPTHWAIKAKEANHWIGLVAEAVRAAGPAPVRLPLKRAKLQLTRFSSVSPDADGLVSGFKHVVDGLVRAGVLVNDKFVNIGFPEFNWVKVPPKQGRIRVVLISEPEEQGSLDV